ncbi:hypothetical protein GCM10010172_04520 [Paractinoplanes ferrugineus]|uniref:Uncharacterized protein n=1 Tax=Paractinoplanes ferrugineus TaxID=113564 RepID=A0A919JBL8_9ACTN|nr:hypothetical protein [Actinoplanes ferrugineus]GIE16837.1 hypothetical protein Afe05nite_86770 [Actinoplanes ferrugineus]
MSGPNERQFGVNDPYRRRFPDPHVWASNGATFGDWAVEMTRQRVNELSWETAGQQLGEEIEQVLAGEAPMPPSVPVRRRMRRGEPGE